MSLLSRLFSRNPSSDPLDDSVTFDEVEVVRRHPDGRMELVEWKELREVAVMVRRNERGQASAHIVLTGLKTGLIVDARTKGTLELVSRLSRLAGFKRAAFDEAMGANQRMRVVCWRPPGMPEDPPERTGMGAPARAPAPARVPDLEPLSMEGFTLHDLQSQAPAPPPPSPRRSGGGALDMRLAPALSTVTGYAGDVVRNMANVYKVEMDWSLESLAHIDRAIAAWHAGGAPLDQVNKSMYSMGSYAGQVLLRHARGRWIEPPDSDEQVVEMAGLFLRIELGDGRHWNPIWLCIEALTDGPGHGLLRSAREVLAGQGNA